MFVIRLIRITSILFACNAVLSGEAWGAARPSFDCRQAKKGGILFRVCNDEELGSLDRQLSSVFAAALARAKNEHPPILKTEQRGWIKERDECWKAEDKFTCIKVSYQRRIAELQAKYRLVDQTGPVTFICDDKATGDVVVTYFKTEPLTLIAERGDSVSLMYHQPSGSGSRYQGRNESFWEHHGEAKIVWGYGSPETICNRAPSR